jgi:uncharacterized protein (TIGR03663 family)
MSADLPADSSQAFLQEQARPLAPEIFTKSSYAPSQGVRGTVFLLLAVLGLAIRLPQLGVRPMHTDEAVNAYIVGQLLAGQSYTYDPRDRHGPALAAFALPLARLQGAKAFSDLTESDLRLTSVLAGTVTILLFGAAVELFGFAPCVIAALLFAGASLPVYYGRYFIHQSLFAAATFGLIMAGWRACAAKHSAAQAALAAACAALMLACKETAVLQFFALAAAAFVYWLWNLHRKSLRGLLRPKSVLTVVVVFLLLTVALFSWFGSNWKALCALAHAVPNFLARAGGEGHQKSFWYFARLLTGGRSGGLIVALACIGLILAVRKRTPSPYAFLAYYAVFLFVIYSLIPYKTPWLALNFWLPIALLAGFAIDSIWRLRTKHSALRVAMPAVCILLCAAAAVLIAHDTRQRVFLHPADEDNPYAYAHTSEDLLGLPVELADLVHQEGLASPRIAVIAADPWPLPWYLRHYAQVGFWQPGQQVPPADFYITSTDSADMYASQLRNFRADFFGIRPNVLILLWSPAPK